MPVETLNKMLMGIIAVVVIGLLAFLFVENMQYRSALVERTLRDVDERYEAALELEAQLRAEILPGLEQLRSQIGRIAEGNEGVTNTVNGLIQQTEDIIGILDVTNPDL